MPALPELQPDNILISISGCPKVADFGESRHAAVSAGDDTAMMTMAVGTKAYMAPELLADEAYSGKVDVFAFALCLYQILVWNSGALKHKRSSFGAIVGGWRPPFSQALLGAYPEIVQIIRDGWAQDPSVRLDSSEMVRRLEMVAPRAAEV